MVIPIATEMLSLYQTENRKLHDNGGKNINNPCLSMRYGKSHHRFTFRGQNCSRTDKMRMVCAKRKTTCDPGTVICYSTVLLILLRQCALHFH